MNWHSVKYRPLIRQSQNGWVATEDGDKEFLAALQYFNSTDKKLYWWIRHCVLQDGELYVVGDDDNEPAGWTVDAVEFWTHIEPPTF